MDDSICVYHFVPFHWSLCFPFDVYNDKKVNRVLSHRMIFHPTRSIRLLSYHVLYHFVSLYNPSKHAIILVHHVAHLN